MAREVCVHLTLVQTITISIDEYELWTGEKATKARLIDYAIGNRDCQTVDTVMHSGRAMVIEKQIDDLPAREAPKPVKKGRGSY